MICFILQQNFNTLPIPEVLSDDLRLPSSTNKRFITERLAGYWWLQGRSTVRDKNEFESAVQSALDTYHNPDRNDDHFYDFYVISAAEVSTVLLNVYLLPPAYVVEVLFS